MNTCPITLDVLKENEAVYSKKGLNLLSYNLSDLKPLELSVFDLRAQAMLRATKMSIQGVQPKLSARLMPLQNKFEIVDNFGTYILKPPSEMWPELPANEALSMKMAQVVGLDVPIHGLVYNKDGEFIYFIKRFDRYKKNQKYALEDFAQLSLLTRDTKYNSSMEKVAKIIEKYCSFALKEKIKLFKLTLFSYLIGNEDMHLKNFSLISRNDVVEISPVYDLLNTSIALNTPLEEFALPIHGKKHKLNRGDFIDYFAKKVLNLNDKIIEEVLKDFLKAQGSWQEYIIRSKLSELMKDKYFTILQKRLEIF